MGRSSSRSNSVDSLGRSRRKLDVNKRSRNHPYSRSGSRSRSRSRSFSRSRSRSHNRRSYRSSVKSRRRYRSISRSSSPDHRRSRYKRRSSTSSSRDRKDGYQNTVETKVKKNETKDAMQTQLESIAHLTEEEQMQALMGFDGFQTTKGQLVPENIKSAARGAVRKEQKRNYRQYMNRRGGFNRQLDKK